MLISQGQTQKKNNQAPEKQAAQLRQVLQGIALSAVILLGIEFLVLPIYMAYLAT